MDEPRFNPVKLVRWTELVQEVLRGGKAGPIRANVDLTNLCQDHCAWCEPLAYREETIRDLRHTLDVDVGRAVLNDLAEMGCRMVHFSGGGEPLLHPHFDDLLRLAHELGMRTFVVTNGGRMERWLSELGAYANHIRVSLDASNQAEHTAVHGSRVGAYGRIWTAMEKIVRSCEILPRVELGVGYVLTDVNCQADSLVRVMRLAESLPVDFLQFRPVSEPEPRFFKETPPGWHATALWLESTAPTVCPRVKLWATGARASDVFHQRDFSRCYSALTVAVIGADGRVSACCDERGIVFGNVNERPFREIWLSPEHRERAASIVPRLCQRCLQCSFNKAVESFVVRDDALVDFV